MRAKNNPALGGVVVELLRILCFGADRLWAACSER